MKYWLLISALFSALNLFAQDPPAEMWVGVAVPVHFGKKDNWQWHNDAGYRTNGVSVLPHQALYRTGIRHFFNGHFNAAAGGALFFTRISYDKDDREFGQENRLWQEVVHLTNQKAAWRVQSRFRLEQRFFEPTELRAAFYATRFRYRSALVYAPTEKIQLHLADEYMQQLSNNKMQFNQNRLIASAFCTLKKQSQLQFSYIWQYRSASSSQSIIAVIFQKSIGINGNN
ncbi:DUF2490 domain-containing protein [Lacibacter luteus]|uniref:DUF2490 domain-containing protein n=1 Tax=Lacibacter luteus TaxID=2508719 RepID=A0A4Q1CN69_9BACT|nr:DUF2490 domain-containing protein [Lacibacter luteus]RXK62516.1 DUF2490 domain-containing protein [Lacibacter luteus]